MTVVNCGGLILSSQKRLKGKKERTKEIIFKNAVALFLEHGYDNTTVQEITEKADVAKGTFFSHFPTKDSILTYLGEQRVEMMREHLENELFHIDCAKEQIHKLFDLLAIASEEDKEVTKLIAYERLKTLYSSDFANETKNKLELRNILENILSKGQQNEEFRKDFLPIHVADILIGIYFYTMLQWIAKDQQTSLIKEFGDKVSIILDGILIDRG